MTLISKEELLDALYERFGEDLDNDTGCYVCTDNGNLDGSLSGDGIHLKASAYEFWDKSLFENAVVRDAEDYSGQENPVFEEYVQETAEEEEETEESGGEGE